MKDSKPSKDTPDGDPKTGRKKAGRGADKEQAPAPAEKETPAQDNSEQEPQPGGPPWEAELDDYPLRDKSEDPRWAVRTVWLWVAVALAAVVFILVLLVLGAIYD